MLRILLFVAGMCPGSLALFANLRGMLRILLFVAGAIRAVCEQYEYEMVNRRIGIQRGVRHRWFFVWKGRRPLYTGEGQLDRRFIALRRTGSPQRRCCSAS
jgi:hypothetical protein